MSTTLSAAPRISPQGSARRVTVFVAVLALVLLGIFTISSTGSAANAPDTAGETAVFGCPDEFVVHNVDCTHDFGEATTASATPDYTRYGCAGGTQPLAPWCAAD